MPSNKLLPDQDSEQPISKQELYDLWKAGAQNVNEAKGWLPEVTEGSVQVHRWTEVLDPDSGKCVERCCVETVVQASPITALLLVKDPQRRKLWDDFLGQSMQNLRVNDHEFIRFHFEGVFGLAAKSFLLWHRVQAFDRGGTERAGGEGAFSWVMLWRPSTVDWRGLPVVDEEYDKSIHWGVIAEPDNASKTRTRLKIFVRIKHISTILTRNAIPTLLQNYSVKYCNQLQEVAASRTWNDIGDDLLGPRRVGAEQKALQPPKEQPAGLSREVPGVAMTGAGGSWSPDKGLASAQNSAAVTTSSEAVFMKPPPNRAPEDVELPAYQLRYERSRGREDPPPLEPLAGRLADALSDWRETNLKREPRSLPPLLAAEVTDETIHEIAGFRGTDAWLDSLLASMSKVQIIKPPWVKQEPSGAEEKEIQHPNKPPDVWDRLAQVGLGHQPPDGNPVLDRSGGKPHVDESTSVGEQDESGMFGGFTSAGFTSALFGASAPEESRLSIASKGSDGSDPGRRKARQSMRRSTAAFSKPMKQTGHRLTIPE